MNWTVTVRLISLIAIGFSILGLWLVIPFFGLELIAIFVAFYIVSCNAKRLETIDISEYKITIKQHRPLAIKTREVQTFELDKIWARVLIKKAPYRNHADKLFIVSHGVQLEVASMLTEDERNKFA
jgi:uncharacterized membrane protein